MSDITTIMREVVDDLQWLPEHIARIVTKRSEAILYEIASDCCQYGPAGCDGKLMTSLEKQGRNFPVCQKHYPLAMSNPDVTNKTKP